MVVEDRFGFQPGQRVRVREEGRITDSRPDESLLGKEGIIWYGSSSEDGGLTDRYFVEFDSGAVVSISPNWLESAE